MLGIDYFSNYDVVIQLFIALNLAFTFISPKQLSNSFSWLLFNKYDYLMEKISSMKPFFSAHTTLTSKEKNGIARKIELEETFIGKKKELATIYDPYQHISFSVFIFSFVLLVFSKFFIVELFYLYLLVISIDIFIEKIWGMILFQIRLKSFMDNEFTKISLTKMKENVTLHHLRLANYGLKNNFFVINIILLFAFIILDCLLEYDIISFNYELNVLWQKIATGLFILNLFAHFIYLYLFQLLNGRETEKKANKVLNYLISRKEEINLEVMQENTDAINSIVDSIDKE